MVVDRGVDRAEVSREPYDAAARRADDASQADAAARDGDGRDPDGCGGDRRERGRDPASAPGEAFGEPAVRRSVPRKPAPGAPQGKRVREHGEGEDEDLMDDPSTRTDDRASSAARPQRTSGEGEAWPRLYGKRGRIGLVVPPANTTNEAEFALYAPDGVTTHTMRAPLDPAGADTDPTAAIAAAATHLVPAGCDILALGDMEASLGAASERLAARVGEATGLRAVTTFGAIVTALETLAVRRLAIATPRGDGTAAAERAAFEAAGFEVVTARGLGIGDELSERSRIARIPRTVLMTFLADIMTEAERVEALVIGCTDLPTIDLVAVLEDAYDVPVVTGNQATLWCLLRSLGLDEINLSLGALFLRSLGRNRLS